MTRGWSDRPRKGFLFGAGLKVRRVSISKPPCVRIRSAGQGDFRLLPTISAVALLPGPGPTWRCARTLAKESAYFLFTRIGLIPDAGGTYWLQDWRLGCSERISASEAADWGMIWRCVPDEEFEDSLAETARHLARGPTEAYRLAKQALGLSLEQSLEQQLDIECRLQGQASRTRDFREGVLAFLEKRPPEFEGR